MSRLSALDSGKLYRGWTVVLVHRHHDECARAAATLLAAMCGFRHSSVSTVIELRPVDPMRAVISAISPVRIWLVKSARCDDAITRYLIPVLALFSFVGAYASRNAAFDVYLMLICGALGYLMKRTGYSPAAFVMGVSLASIADNELIRTVQLYGDEWYWAFVTRPLAAAILLLLLSTIVWNAFSSIFGRPGGKRRSGPVDHEVVPRSR